MKFVISLIFICQPVLASPIHLYYETECKTVQSFRDHMTKEYQIPDELITVKIIQKCEDLRAVGKLDLCLKNNGDLFLVSADRDFINESLKVFQAP